MKVLKLSPIIVLIFLALLFVSACGANQTLTLTISPTETSSPPQFDGELALQHIATQLEFGPRTPGSEGHAEAVAWMLDELESNNWDVAIQEIPTEQYTIQNIVAKKGQGRTLAHFGCPLRHPFFC